MPSRCRPRRQRRLPRRSGSPVGILRLRLHRRSSTPAMPITGERRIAAGLSPTRWIGLAGATRQAPRDPSPGVEDRRRLGQPAPDRSRGHIAGALAFGGQLSLWFPGSRRRRWLVDSVDGRRVRIATYAAEAGVHREHPAPGFVDLATPRSRTRCSCRQPHGWRSVRTTRTRSWSESASATGSARPSCSASGRRRLLS